MTNEVKSVWAKKMPDGNVYITPDVPTQSSGTVLPTYPTTPGRYSLVVDVSASSQVLTWVLIQP